MPLDWIDTKDLSFNHLLLLERVQLSWFPGWLPEAELAVALRANPVVAWYMQHKCPEIAAWLGQVQRRAVNDMDQQAVYDAEQKVLRSIEDLLVYAIDPALYDARPFLGWDSAELTGLVDFRDKLVLDIGAGTGRLAFSVAPLARTVWAVELVANLRDYMRAKARRLGFDNFYTVDGLITGIPFPDGFADVTMGGHVFGGNPEPECSELERVTRSGGMVILCPGSSETEQEAHACLLAHGYEWARFEEPQDGWKRKYWKVLIKG
jgi:SAM-dependent methyltransferase